MKLKKFIALTMVASMALMPMTVQADDTTDPDAASGGVTETGGLEGYVDKNVFRVVLPTQNSSGNGFTLDPQGLLKVADSNNYMIGAGALYFPNASGNEVTYSNTSDPYEIQNKSSYAVDVAFGVDVTLPTGVSLVEDSALADATSPSVYLAMKEGDTTTTLKSGANAAATKELEGIAEDTEHTTKADAVGYIITATGNATDGYQYAYELGDRATVSASGNASYTLTGACDYTADWSAVNELDDNKDLTLNITWSVTKHSDTPASAAPSIATTEYTLTADTALNIPVDLGAGDKAATGVKSILMGTTEQMPTYATYADGKITISVTSVNYLMGTSGDDTLTVIFNDTDETEVTLTLK